LWLDRLAADGPNLRAALEFSLGDGGSERGVRLAAALWWFWVIRTYLTEGRRWLEAAVDVLESARISPLIRAKVLYCAGYVANVYGDRAHGSAWAEAGLAASRELGDDRSAAYALSCIALGALLDGDSSAVRPAVAEAADLFRKTGDMWGLRLVLNGLGELERSLKNFEQAETLYVECLALARQEQDAHGIGLVLLNLGMLALQQGRPPRAAELIREASHIWMELGYRTGLVACLGVMASNATVNQHPELAVRLFSARLHIGKMLMRSELEYDRSVVQGYLKVARESLDGSAYDAAWASGAELTLEQAIAEGLAMDSAPGGVSTEPVSGHEPLTVREWEVAQLVARGLTNRQIASELIVSEATAAKHVENIRAKLELSSRTQVAAWVFSKGKPSHASTE
jgi:non-specific serine/threonine protein kinase